jgi:iron complex transport system ATP-binding protein
MVGGMTTLTVRQLLCRREGKAILDRIDISFAEGQLTAIVGPNGAGKTTLLRHLVGLEVPEAGTIELNGQSLTALPSVVRAGHIAYLPQAASAYWPLTGHDLVALGRLPHGADLSGPLKITDQEAVTRALERVDGAALADRAIDTLSQGERARLMLARTLATEAAILLADEPVASLDPAYALQAMDVLRAEAARGVTVIVVLHDLGLAARFAHRILVLANAGIAADGPPVEALGAGVIDVAYGVGFRHVEVDGVMQPVAWERR